MAQVVGSLAPLLETQIEFLASGFSYVQLNGYEYLVSEPNNGRAWFDSVCLSLYISPSFSTCFSAFQIKNNNF